MVNLDAILERAGNLGSTNELSKSASVETSRQYIEKLAQALVEIATESESTTESVVAASLKEKLAFKKNEDTKSNVVAEGLKAKLKSLAEAKSAAKEKSVVENLVNNLGKPTQPSQTEEDTNDDYPFDAMSFLDDEDKKHEETEVEVTDAANQDSNVVAETQEQGSVRVADLIRNRLAGKGA